VTDPSVEYGYNPAYRGIVLDLFCKAGGASMGYSRAGYRVIGVDIERQRNYPFEGCWVDWRRGLEMFGESATLIHASPPCQAFTWGAGWNRRRRDHPDLITPVRAALIELGKPYVIENVPQAPLIDPITFCGSEFDIPIIRHRSFECSFPVKEKMCRYSPMARNVHPWHVAYPYGRKSWEPAWREHVLPRVWPWMTVEEAGQAIPPEYTEHIARCSLKGLA
jgi:DNA (cytosine-5)-methyltransferase 1